MVLRKYLLLLPIISFFGCLGTKKLSETDISYFRKKTKPDIVVFYLAHQDDDVFISSKIQEHINNCDSVFVIYTCLSYQRGDNYKLKRIFESKSALNFLGLNSSQIVFLGYPDTKSHKHLNNLISTTDSLFKIIKPNLIYTSAYEGGNIDHDVANFVINFLRNKKKISALLYEFPEYSAYKTKLFFKMRNFPDMPKTEIRELNRIEFKTVKMHWDFYKSQKIPLGIFIRITAGEKKTFGYEYIRQLSYYDYSQLSPTNSVAYERYLDATFEEFIFEVKKITHADNN